jgi:nitrile hydratase subunit beta
MNGVHDMGGMQGYGPIRAEMNEPVFHAPWEGRVITMVMGIAAWGKFGVDQRRYVRELIPPAEFLQMSYYEIWYTGLVANLLDAQMVTRAEIESAMPAAGSAKLTPALMASRVPTFFANGAPKKRNVPSRATFRVGQRVRAKNINPPTHTRLPRYARGKIGVVTADRGIYVFPDTSATGQGEKPQHLYSVRFEARELWGAQAKPKDSVYIDMWDDYLERA